MQDGEGGHNHSHSHSHGHDDRPRPSYRMYNNPLQKFKKESEIVFLSCYVSLFIDHKVVIWSDSCDSVAWAEWKSKNFDPWFWVIA